MLAIAVALLGSKLSYPVEMRSSRFIYVELDKCAGFRFGKNWVWLPTSLLRDLQGKRYTSLLRFLKHMRYYLDYLKYSMKKHWYGYWDVLVMEVLE